jgi:hypothetical protein
MFGWDMFGLRISTGKTTEELFVGEQEHDS